MPDLARPLRHHLRELRGLLVRVCAALAIGVCGAAFFLPQCFAFLIAPYHRLLAAAHALPTTGGLLLQSLDPSEAFRLSFHVALIFGAVVVSPYLLYAVWHFIRPGLLPQEQRLLGYAGLAGLGLFAAGAAFAHFVIAPLLLHMFWDYSLSLGITPNWTVGHYFDFVLGLLVAFGGAFELPLLIIALVGWGIVTPASLRAARRYVYFGIMVLAAVLTPPDLASCLLMAVPLLGLYELALAVAGILRRTP